MYDVVFPLPDGGVWVVRAYHYDTLEQARAVWSKHESSTRGGDWDFSVWAVASPEMTDGLVVFCGPPDGLPVITDGEPLLLPVDQAKQFVLRRARVSADAWEEQGRPKTGYFETRDRYGIENPQVIDEEGRATPWQKK